MAVIAGNVETGGPSSNEEGAWGGGINNFPRFMERWSGTPTNIKGSLVIAFRSVYSRHPWTHGLSGVNNYLAPERIWEYDTNLDLPGNQPPGTPSFFVQAMQDWDRD